MPQDFSTYLDRANLSPPHLFQARVIAKALALYQRTGRPLNSSYTPTKMMKMAEKITGKGFKKRDYLSAAKALEDYSTCTSLTEE